MKTNETMLSFFAYSFRILYRILIMTPSQTLYLQWLLVKQYSENPCVGGSIPPLGTITFYCLVTIDIFYVNKYDSISNDLTLN